MSNMSKIFVFYNSKRNKYFFKTFNMENVKVNAFFWLLSKIISSIYNTLVRESLFINELEQDLMWWMFYN